MGLKLVGEVTLDGAGFERGLNRMTSSVKGFVVNAFGLYGIERVLHGTMEKASHVADAIDRLGESGDNIQILEQAAKNAGSELGSVTKAFEKISLAKDKALSGTKEGMELLAKFAKIGISEQDLRTKTRGELFMGPISKAASDKNQEDLAPILKDILGKGFGELLPVLKTDFEDLEKQMRSLGAIMGEETVFKLDLLGDELSLLGNILLSQVAPALVAFSEFLVKAAVKGMGLLAGASAAFGGGTFGMSPAKATAAVLSKAALETLTLPLRGIATNVDDVIKNVMEGVFGYDYKAASAAKKEGEKPYDEALAKIQKMIDDITAKVKAGPPKRVGETDDTSVEDKPKKMRPFKDSSDSLVRVGNFLGTNGRNVIEDINRKQLVVAEKQLQLSDKQLQLTDKIAKNTDPRALLANVLGLDNH